LAVGFGPKNFAFARKITALPESGRAAAPSPPGSYAYDYDSLYFTGMSVQCNDNLTCVETYG